jgi:hypothetical protein
VDGRAYVAMCLAETSLHGSMTIGNLTVATKASNHQFGLVTNAEEASESTVVAPAGGVLVDEPVELPGELRELVCSGEASNPWRLCDPPHGRGWREHGPEHVTWTVESAGVPSNFNLVAGEFPNVPFALVPVKIHLQNEMLGENCYIGTDREPIVFEPANLALLGGGEELFDPDGTADQTGGSLNDLRVLSTQGASGFAVPAATGCGFGGRLDQAIDKKIGLPSPAGAPNSIVFDEASSDLIYLNNHEALAPNEGKELSKDWHSAIVPPAEEHSHHEHGGGWRHWSRDQLETYVERRFGRR